MKKTNLKIIANLIAILFVSFILWYSQSAIYQISEPFIEMEKSEAEFIVKLIRDNYSEIKSISNKEKDTVISNFKDTELSATNIIIMRGIALYLLNTMFIAMIVYLFYSSFITYRKSRYNKAIKKDE